MDQPITHKKGPDDAIAGPEGTAPITVMLEDWILGEEQEEIGRAHV